jgi:hypothetical protein
VAGAPPAGNSGIPQPEKARLAAAARTAGIAITSPGRVLFPEFGLTKEQLAGIAAADAFTAADPAQVKAQAARAAPTAAPRPLPD